MDISKALSIIGGNLTCQKKNIVYKSSNLSKSMYYIAFIFPALKYTLF